jgi:hypothetical protein
MNITQEQRAKVAEVINAGLVRGLGEPEPGKLCIEAAICLAMGEPHGDEPTCVAEPDRLYAIKLQDRYPGNAAERAALFLPLGLAQLGTAGTDRRPWIVYVAEQTIRRIVPLALRAAAKVNPKHAEKLESAAVRCEKEGTKASAASAYTAASAASAKIPVFELSVAIALEAYALEGRHP